MNNVRSKLFAFLFSIVLVISSTAIYAQALTNMTPMEIPELSMTVDIPTEAKTVLSPVRKNDPIFSDGAFDYITIMTKMRSDNALLYGKSADYEIEIISPEQEANINNLTSLSAKKKEKAMSEFSKQSDINDCKIYEGDDVTFFETSRTANGIDGRFFYCDYTTIYNSRYITVRIISENDYINDMEKEIAKTMADSIIFPQKRRVSISMFPIGRITFALILFITAYVMVIIYRRDEEKYNVIFANVWRKIKNKSEIHNNKTNDEKPKRERRVVVDEPEDEDLSEIDLDDAIAFFDDDTKGN